MNPTEPSGEIPFVLRLLRELETIQAYLEHLELQLKNKQNPEILQKSRGEIDEKIRRLEDQKAELYALLSNLDFMYHQGQLSYDDYRSRMAAILRNQPLEHYILKIDHCIQQCREKIP